jgi:hypothetical protein
MGPWRLRLLRERAGRFLSVYQKGVCCIFGRMSSIRLGGISPHGDWRFYGCILL